jgi:hypothetical protein
VIDDGGVGLREEGRRQKEVERWEVNAYQWRTNEQTRLTLSEDPNDHRRMIMVQFEKGADEAEGMVEGIDEHD